LSYTRAGASRALPPMEPELAPFMAIPDGEVNAAPESA